jgi:hypothetical protein
MRLVVDTSVLVPSLRVRHRSAGSGLALLQGPTISELQTPRPPAA